MSENEPPVRHEEETAMIGWVQIEDSPSFILGTALAVKALLRSPPRALDERQRKAVYDARAYIERAKAGKTVLRTDEAGVVPHSRAVHAYASVRDAIRGGDASDELLEGCIHVLSRLEEGTEVAKEDSDRAHQLFSLVARAMDKELSSQSRSFSGEVA